MHIWFTAEYLNFKIEVLASYIVHLNCTYLIFYIYNLSVAFSIAASLSEIWSPRLRDKFEAPNSKTINPKKLKKIEELKKVVKYSYGRVDKSLL